jgi:hypothetical protein
MSSVRDYLERGELHGAHTIWELAVNDGLSAEGLIDLQARLRLLDPPIRHDGRGYRVETESRFELRPKERRALARRLFAEGGELDRRHRDKLGMSQPTAWRIAREFGRQTPLPEAASEAGLRNSKRPTATLIPDPPYSGHTEVLINGLTGDRQEDVDDWTLPLLSPPRPSRPEGMPPSLCGLCPRRHVRYATARAAEVNEPGGHI